MRLSVPCATAIRHLCLINKGTKIRTVTLIVCTIDPTMTDKDNQIRLRSNSLSKSGGKGTEADMTVAELANLMQSQLANYQRTVKDDFKKLGDSLSSLTTQMSKLREDISSDIEKLREENNRTFDNLTTSIDTARKETSLALDRSARINDLVVSGIPFLDGENLLSYFHTWCKSFGYAEKNYPLVDVRRLSKGILTAGNVYMILLQFAITVQRNDFYSRYLRSRSLSLSGIGFSVDKRIYINENLGPNVRNLRSKALQLKKDGKLRGVFTRNGILFVKKIGEEKEIAISTDDEFHRSARTLSS